MQLLRSRTECTIKCTQCRNLCTQFTAGKESWLIGQRQTSPLKKAERPWLPGLVA